MGKGMRADKKQKAPAMNQKQQMAQMQALQRQMDETQEKINQIEQTASSNGGTVSYDKGRNAGCFSCNKCSA